MPRSKLLDFVERKWKSLADDLEIRSTVTKYRAHSHMRCFVVARKSRRTYGDFTQIAEGIKEKEYRIDDLSKAFVIKKSAILGDDACQFHIFFHSVLKTRKKQDNQLFLFQFVD